MKYFSMFSGIGGFELAIQQAYDDLQAIDKLVKLECVGYSEIDRYAIQIYRKHFPKHKNYGDAKNIIPREIPDFDLLVAGFPCQSFSIAGKRRGFDDTRGTLFFEIARVLRDKKPRYFLLENVKGLLSNKSGKTFQTILGVLTDLGYELEWQVLNSKNFGVPQNRERVFIIGHFGKGSRPKVFPITKSNEENYEKCFKTFNSSDWQRTNKNQGQNLIKILDLNNAQGQRVYSIKGISQTLAGNAGGWGGKTGLYLTKEPMVMDLYNKKMKKESPTLTEPHHNTIRLSIDYKIRRLTPIECERLQGFPDNWTKYGIDENGNEVIISDTQRYKTLGNAVTINVVKAIMDKLKTQL